MTKCSEDLSPSSTIVTTQITPQLSAFVPFFRHKRIDKKKSIITKRQSQVTDGRGAESCLIRTKWMCGVFSSGSISPSRLLSSQPSQHRKKSSSCLIHLLLDTHKIQLKPNNNAPPIPRPPSAAIQVSCWGSGLVDFLNPPLPAWGLGKKREQNQ